MLTTTTAVLAAVAMFPAIVRVNAQGREIEDICTNETEVKTLLRQAGFRNSIDHAFVEQVN